MTKQFDDNLFDDSTAYTAPAEMDDSLFDDSPAVEAATPEAPSFVERNLDPVEAAKTAAGGAAGFAAGKAVSPFVEAGVEAVADKALDPAAELLAYRAAGGYSGTQAGKELNKKMILDKAGKSKADLADLAEVGVFDNGVNPRSVGREILDNEVLGPVGVLTTKGGNLERAQANLKTKSAPKNAMLSSIEEYPVHQDSIFKRMKEILGYDELNETVPDQANIKKQLDKLNDKSFGDIETPAQAERAKVELQRKADFADPDRTVKNALNTAQSTARKEAVENSVLNALGPEKLEEFKQLKAKAGSAGVAKDMLEELYDKSQKPFSQYNGLIGTGIDWVKQRGSGIGANLLDKASKGVRAGSKAVAPGLGTLIGLTAGAAAAEEQTDSADFIPGLDQASAAGSAFDDKSIQTEVKARQNYDASPARQDFLRKTLETTPEAFKGGFAYKQAQDELNKLEGNYKPSDSLTSGSASLQKASPEQLTELSNQFKNVKGADKFVAPLESAAQASSDEERQARLFGLYQQPAFRQLLKKGSQN